MFEHVQHRKIRKLLFLFFLASQSIVLLSSYATEENLNIYALGFQVFGIAITLVSILPKFATQFESDEFIEISKIKIILALIIILSILISYYHSISEPYVPGHASVQNFQFYDNRLRGFLLGILFGKNIFIRLINGTVMMQGFGSIDWLIFSAKNILIALEDYSH